MKFVIGPSSKLLFLILFLSVTAGSVSAVEEKSFKEWTERFEFKKPLVRDDGQSSAKARTLPCFEVKIDTPGNKLIRVSLPFVSGAFPEESAIKVSCKDKEIIPAFRVLTVHPGKPVFVRRALLTFPFNFQKAGVYLFTVSSDKKRLTPKPHRDLETLPLILKTHNVEVKIGVEQIRLKYHDGAEYKAEFIGPALTANARPKAEIIEDTEHYIWARLLVPDSKWPRIIEVRIDTFGTVAVQAHLQRLLSDDGTAPDIGWKIEQITGSGFKKSLEHSFAEGKDFNQKTSNGRYEVYFPTAPFKRRGVVTVDNKTSTIQYLRCRLSEQVPFQELSWRRAEFVIGSSGNTRLNYLLEPEVDITIQPEIYDSIYSCGRTADLSKWPVLLSLTQYTHQMIQRHVMVGDDFGNISDSMSDEHGSVFGMNRLNHCSAIFEESYRTGNNTLRDIAVQWCSNFNDLTIYWGDRDGCGGTRYPGVNGGWARLPSEEKHVGDKSFMWRSNCSVDFCTKGFDSFFYAYEETGDPRMLAALNTQLAYSTEYVHSDRGQTRNIGVAADFMKLYKFTGLRTYSDEAMRLFRELRNLLFVNYLFDQGGQPLSKNLPFIDIDDVGYKYGYPKPYILGYALEALSDLLIERPDEPKLYETVKSLSDFFAENVDPAGGWRYPHANSSRLPLMLGMEHSAQLCRAGKVLEMRGESIDKLLDAIELVLSAQANIYNKIGTFSNGLEGWEHSTGILKEGKTINDLYKTPAERNPSRDYTEGKISIGNASIDGMVYIGEVLNFYLQHRPAERLFKPNVQLTKVLDRLEK